jgi:hypothetical protein
MKAYSWFMVFCIVQSEAHSNHVHKTHSARSNHEHLITLHTQSKCINTLCAQGWRMGACENDESVPRCKCDEWDSRPTWKDSADHLDFSLLVCLMSNKKGLQSQGIRDWGRVVSCSCLSRACFVILMLLRCSHLWAVVDRGLVILGLYFAYYHAQ